MDFPKDLTLPVIEIRRPTPDEEFTWLEEVLDELDWYDKNGYTITLPSQKSLQKPFGPNERNEKFQEFLEHEYRESFFNKGIEILERNRALFESTLPVFKNLNKKWGFELCPKYTFTLTKYGPGGNYYPKEGRIVMLTKEDGTFKRPNQTHTPIHEMVHIGIEEVIVEKFKLSHWEKERTVDLLVKYLFNDIVPDYQLQERGDRKIDPFVTKETIDNLPASIQTYISKYPR